MVKFRDLTKTLSLCSIQLSAVENELLLQRAARELAERSVLGVVVVPLCFAMVVITSGYVFHSPYTCLVLSLAMFAGAVARRFGITGIRKSGTDQLSTELQVFFWGCLGMAAVWGLTTAIFICTYLEGFPVLLVLVISAGVGAASMVNFCIWRTLAVLFLLAALLPSVLAGMYIQQAELYPAIIGIVFYIFYLSDQIKRWNFHFWDSLITGYLFEKQAEKLAAANSSLAEIIEKEKESRLEVESGREKIRELFNLTNDAIVICSLDGRVLDVNLAMLGMFSGVKGEMVNILSFKLFTMPADSKMSVEDHWQKAVSGMEETFDCKVRGAAEGGSVLVHVNLRRVSWQKEQIIFVTLRDITAKKQIEDALKITKQILSESEGYLQAILSNVELPIYCKDLKGRYLTVNSPFEQLCCLTIEELRGKNDMQVFQKNQASFFNFRDYDIAETGESLELEGTFTFGGQEKNVLIHKFPLRESSGTIYGTAGICTDVTTMQKALRTAQLADEAKSEFLAKMSHELRTPMHSILSIARLGLKRVDSSSREKLESYFKMIVTSGDQMLALLSDLLDLSTLESSRPSYSLREYDLVKDLDRMVSEFKVMMAEREIFLTYKPLVSFAPARYDRTKLYQVVGNLLGNAMKFTAAKTEVRVVLQEDYLEINGQQHAAWKVMVIDQGIGVEQAELESVFGKFVQGSNAYSGAGGVGLGLSICKRIVEDHHGIIWAEQNVVEGAIFCFLLPALDQPTVK
ncbi:MAG: PAS domain-containing sensor histidine kinase [Desulfobulbaceae bacterium]|nr:PAS domain-containing sensor histidine kinase [Desulfobulbaceae bacterium]